MPVADLVVYVFGYHRLTVPGRAKNLGESLPEIAIGEENAAQAARS
jgi:hypothetical protein